MKSPITLLAGIALILGGLALGSSGAFHLVQPPSFEAVTKIRVVQPGVTSGYDAVFMKKETETILSPAVVTNVISLFKLNDVWGKKYNRGQRLSDADVEKMLRVDCRPVRNTDAIEIKVRSEDPMEASILANSIVQSYRQNTMQSKSASVTVVMSATSPTRAISPNRPLSIVVIAVGIFMAIGGIFCLKDSTSGSES